LFARDFDFEDIEAREPLADWFKKTFKLGKYSKKAIEKKKKEEEAKKKAGESVESRSFDDEVFDLLTREIELD